MPQCAKKCHQKRKIATLLTFLTKQRKILQRFYPRQDSFTPTLLARWYVFPSLLWKGLSAQYWPQGCEQFLNLLRHTIGTKKVCILQTQNLLTCPNSCTYTQDSGQCDCLIIYASFVKTRQMINTVSQAQSRLSYEYILPYSINVEELLIWLST